MSFKENQRSLGLLCVTSSIIYLIELSYVKQKLKADTETYSRWREYQINDLTILAYIYTVYFFCISILIFNKNFYFRNEYPNRPIDFPNAKSVETFECEHVNGSSS